MTRKKSTIALIAAAVGGVLAVVVNVFTGIYPAGISPTPFSILVYTAGLIALSALITLEFL
jgi:hypothetical protein